MRTMDNSYKTIRTSGYAEIIEKKSRFIGEVHFAASREEAEDFILKAKKRYFDARHHCFAYIAGKPGGPEEILRQSDDGEPQGTAGKPMLELLQGNSLHCAAAVVTRYFGGTLLGTGGLVRAYSSALREAIENAEIVLCMKGKELTISCSYAAAGKLQYLFAAEGFSAPEMFYGGDVEMILTVPEDSVGKVKKLISEATDGKAEIRTEKAAEIFQPVYKPEKSHR